MHAHLTSHCALMTGRHVKTYVLLPQLSHSPTSAHHKSQCCKQGRQIWLNPLLQYMHLKKALRGTHNRARKPRRAYCRCRVAQHCECCLQIFYPLYCNAPISSWLIAQQQATATGHPALPAAHSSSMRLPSQEPHIAAACGCSDDSTPVSAKDGLTPRVHSNNARAASTVQLLSYAQRHERC